MIDFSQIPETELDIACSVLRESVTKFFKRPGVREDFERWLAQRKETENEAHHHHPSQRSDRDQSRF